jgi:WD40 repeat protein
MRATRWLAVALLATPAVAAPLPEAADEPLPPGAVARLGAAPLRHRGPARAVAFAPDGKTLATSGDDALIRLWDLRTGRQTAACPGPANVWGVLAVLPDGRHAFWFDRRTDGRNNTGHICDLTTGKAVVSFQTKRNLMTGAVSPDGKTVAGAGMDGVYLWDARSGKELHLLTGHKTTVEQVAFSGDGKVLASIAGDRVIRLWDVEAGKELRQVPVPPGHVWFALALNADGKRALLPGQEGGVSVVNTEGHGVVEQLKDAEAGTAYSMAFAPDGKLLATGHRHSVIALWSWPEGRQVARFRLRGSYEAYRSIAFSPDGKTLAAAGEGPARLFDLGTLDRPTLKERAFDAPHPGPLILARFTDEGRNVLVVSAGPFDYDTGAQNLAVVGWALEGKRQTHRFTLDRMKAVADLSPDGKKLAVAAGGVRLLDAVKGERVADVGPQPDDRRPAIDGVTNLTFSPDGKRLAVQTFVNTRVGSAGLTVWDLAKGAAILDEHVRGRQMRGLAFGPNGLTARFDQGSVTVEGGAQAVTIAVGATRSVLFAPDGKALLTAGQQGPKRLRLWDAATGQELRALAEDGPNEVRAFAFAPDGKLLAGAGADGLVRVWDATTGRLRHRLDGHRGAVQAVSFAPDGKRLVSGGADGVAVVWSLEKAPAVGE